MNICVLVAYTQRKTWHIYLLIWNRKRIETAE